eukprot:3258752-Rhodomonas_salina.1
MLATGLRHAATTTDATATTGLRYADTASDVLDAATATVLMYAATATDLLYDTTSVPRSSIPVSRIRRVNRT